MTATRCSFDVDSPTCTDCALYGDCLDELLPPLTLADSAPDPDAPLKLLRDNTPRARRRLTASH